MTQSPPGRRTRRRIVHFVRFLLLLSLILPQMPLVALAAPDAAPPRRR